MDASWFTCERVPGDGDCLFHAVVAQVTEFDVQRLRNVTWLELQANEGEYSDFLRKGDYARRIVQVRRARTWASEIGDITPPAIANALGRTLLVVNRTKRFTASHFHPRGGPTHTPVYLYREANHYSILRPREALLQWEDDIIDALLHGSIHS
jgi:hypothetical protein